MTRQQKNEARLQKEIRKLERDKFILENQIRDLNKKTRDLKLEIFTLRKINEKLDESLIRANNSLQVERDRVTKILTEVSKYTNQDVWSYLKGKTI